MYITIHHRLYTRGIPLGLLINNNEAEVSDDNVIDLRSSTESELLAMVLMVEISVKNSIIQM